MTLLTEGKSSLFYRPKFGDILSVSGKNFIIRDGAGVIQKKIPALSVRDVVIFGETTIESSVFKLARLGEVPIHFTDGRGRLLGSVRYDFSKNVFLRHNQILFHDDPARRLQIAKAIVEAKIANQNTFLKKMRVSNRIREESDAKTLDALRGEEGAAARAYFFAWKTGGVIKNDNFFFPGRVKRPPHDKTNAMLSFCYSMLHTEALTQILIAGLDPHFGFLHDQRYGHAALASDIIEAFRGPVDHFVVRSINLREFSSEDFEKETNGAMKFSSSGLQKFFPKWTKFLRYEPVSGEKKSLIALLERDVRSLALFFMEDEQSFQPFRWKL